MATFISHSPTETEALGSEWGREASEGLVIALSGDLGAGKTQLVKGLARGLGIASRVTSPTFSLVNVYTDGRLPLNHIDLYRLDTVEQIIAAGLEQYLEPEGVSVIEWAERWPILKQLASDVRQSGDVKSNDLHSRIRRVQIETLSDSERRIIYEDFGD